jgi:hypothetical protein
MDNLLMIADNAYGNRTIVGLQFFGTLTSALRLFELARVLLRFNHVARRIVNANYCIM